MIWPACSTGFRTGVEMRDASVAPQPEERERDAEFKAELTALLPQVRAFAHFLCRDRAAADDLAQESLLRAWGARASFQPGSHMRAWATVNKQTGGGNKSGSGRGVPDTNLSAERGGKLGGRASAARPAAQRSASARKAAATRKRSAKTK